MRHSGDFSLVDSHCHLDRYNNPREVVAAGKKAGVQAFLTVCVSVENFSAVEALVCDFPTVYGSIGVHPCDVGKAFSHLPDEEAAQAVYAWLIQGAHNPKIVAFGETGLDFLPTSPPVSRQIAFLQAHVRAAHACNMPLIIHMRNSEEVFLEFVAEEKKRYASLPLGVMHCFTGSLLCAQKMCQEKWMISFSGIVTFSNSLQIQDVAKTISLDNMLIETDSPWLAPQPHRGQINYPAYVLHVAHRIQALRQEPFEEIAQTLWGNFFRLFSKAKYIAEN